MRIGRQCFRTSRRPRHFPPREVHPHAELAAEAAEVAGAQNKFWRMHYLLFATRSASSPMTNDKCAIGDSDWAVGHVSGKKYRHRRCLLQRSGSNNANYARALDGADNLSRFSREIGIAPDHCNVSKITGRGWMIAPALL